jgi:biopolymer transport protein ExbD
MSDHGKTKGSAARTIVVPGYHIRPEWDLVHTRHLLDERRGKKRIFSLMLAPMVDMFSILVIYLLMNFSTSGEAFFVSREVTLPKAKKGVPMRSYPLISLVGENVIFDAETIGNDSNVKVTEPNDQKVPGLRAMLQRLRKIDEQLGGAANFHGQVNIQADENAPIEDVKKVMRVLIEENWTSINFIVDPTEKK